MGKKVGIPHPIVCLETDVVYSTVQEAADDLGISRRTLSRYMSGITHHKKGLHFEYIPYEMYDYIIKQRNNHENSTSGPGHSNRELPEIEDPDGSRSRQRYRFVAGLLSGESSEL